jgi:hypothetical protein
MGLQGLARFAPLSGLVAVVLWIVSVAVIEGGDTPGDKAPGTEIAAYFDRESGRILFGTVLFCLGAAAFIWFLGSLAARLRATVGDGRLASIVFGAGVATATMWACVVAPVAAGALAYDNRERALSPEAAEALWLAGDGFFIVAEYLGVAFMGAAALAILRGRVLPAWFGWVTGLIAIALIIPWIGWAGLIFAIPLWTLVTSIWLFVKRPAPETPVAAPGPAA